MAKAKRDYYEVLGVSTQDTEEGIRKAFRKKALEYHPDRNKDPNAEDRFKEINEAYQVLSDPQKRARYDRFGHAGVSTNGADQGFQGFDTFGGFGDIFDAFFGDISGGRAHKAQRGADVQQRVVLSFEEAAFGVEREVEISRIERCSRCSGDGNEPGTKVKSCATCRGTGQVRRAQRSLFGQFAQISSCPTCHGKGSTVEVPCAECRGNGVQRRRRKVAVKIPAGVESGMQVRITGGGDAGANGGPPGGLYVHVEVEQHAFFLRDEYDLVYQLPINLAEAALGVEKEVPTLEGAPERVKIPAGTQAGVEFCLRNKGIPHINSNRRGDLRAVVEIQVPPSLSSQQRKLLEELARTLDPSQETGDSPDEDSAKDKGIFDRIKDVLT